MDLPDEPWTRNDVFAVNALKGQFVGQGGGDEARRTQFFSGLTDTLGAQRGLSVFNDLRQFKNPGNPTSVDGKFKYGHLPKRRRGNAIIDPGSFEPTPAADVAGSAAAAAHDSPEASNTLMITAERSTTGNPLMVGGPQIGYFYPGLTYEIDMNAPGLRWRGATTAPFPGYMLIGRGVDFATTLTSAGGDIIDQFAERLCGGSDEMYRYKGKCRSMEEFNAGELDGEPVDFLRTVHGPVVGYATVNGNRVAIAQQRSSYGKDTVDQLFYRRLSSGKVDDPRSFFNAAAKTPADVQLVLHRQRAHRRVHERQAADPGPRRRPRPADEGQRQVRVARVPRQEQAHPRHRSARRDDHELEQHLRARVRRRGR